MHIESDENGFWLIHETGAIPVADPERLYDSVKGQIGPWLREQDEARGTRIVNTGTGIQVFACDPDESGGYDISDPKHPAFHSTHADIHDARAGK